MTVRPYAAALKATFSHDFSFASEAAMYLDMVNDPRSRDSEAESRRLAGSLAAS